MNEIPDERMQSRPQCSADAVIENFLNFLKDQPQCVQICERMVTDMLLPAYFIC
jgi:hypothetical protein